jgi:hypothetical protein
MEEIEQMTIVARERADKRIDTALGEMHAAAHKIGVAQKIPENIAGLSIEELLGRMAYIPTMARDLRRACGQELAKQELNAFLDTTPVPSNKAASKLPPPIEPSKIPETIPVGMDVGDLDGVSTQTIAALRNAGLNSVGDVVAVPDEHLAKMQGLGEKSVAHIRAAIAKAT